MKTQEEYAHEIDEIVRRDVESCQRIRTRHLFWEQERPGAI